MQQTDILKDILQGKTLSAPQSQAIFDAILSDQDQNGAWSDAHIAALLSLLAMRGETDQEILGAARAMRHHAAALNAPEGAIDCCGTGGDAASSAAKNGTLNISTAVAFVLAGLDVPVAKHGNRAASSRSGAADVLESIGVPLESNVSKLESALTATNFCFLMAPHHHKAMKRVAPIRKALGFRTIFNMLGPLSNPAGVKFQLIGVFDRKLLHPFANALKELGSTGAWIVHGRDGMDEITVTDKTDIVCLGQDGRITERTIDPQELGLKRHSPSSLNGGDAAHNAAALAQLLSGEPSADTPFILPDIAQESLAAYHDIVCLNAAAALVITGKAADLPQGLAMAKDCIAKGHAWKKLNDYKDFLSRQRQDAQDT